MPVSLSRQGEQGVSLAFISPFVIYIQSSEAKRRHWSNSNRAEFKCISAPLL